MMSFQDTSTSPHFANFVRRLVQLHKLIAAGRDESDEGEALRDEMDHPWYQMDKSERDVAGSLSADLYTIGGDRRSPDNSSDEVAAEIREAHDRAKWPRVLELLREHEQELPSDEVAAHRGVCWGNMGQYIAAVEFLREAVRLSDGNSKYDKALASALLYISDTEDSAEYVTESLRHAEAFSADKNDSEKLFLAAWLYFVNATRSQSDDAETWYNKTIDIGKKAISLAMVQGKTDLLRKQIVELQINLAVCCWQLGRMDAALRHCEEALTASPDSEKALLLRGWLRRDDDRQAADNDFFQGLNRSIDLHSAMRDYPTQTLVFD